MAPTIDVDADMKYLLLVIKNAEFKPKYGAVAKEAGINNANNAQKRFKKLVENGGFKLVSGAVVSRSDSKAEDDPITPAKNNGKKPATPVSKKRKVQETEEEGEVMDGPKSEEE